MSFSKIPEGSSLLPVVVMVGSGSLSSLHEKVSVSKHSAMAYVDFVFMYVFKLQPAAIHS